MGRLWHSPPGNLYASTLVRIQPADPPPATLGFVAAIAVHELLSAYVGSQTISLKWPNDVMAGPAKLAGILLERSLDSVVVGIGINLATVPPLADRPVSSVAALCGNAPDPSDCLEHLAEGFGRAVAQWRSGGLPATLGKWQACAHVSGTALQVNLPDGETITGLYEGLNRDGALKLRSISGSVRMIHAGDVFLM
jgi:BirA family biotin operon repressor/biotin-[acetyl-CoA-carboxylase] ligase